MKRTFLVLLLILVFGVTTGYCAARWRDASTDFFDGDLTEFNIIDTEVDEHMIDPLERLLTNARNGALVEYASAATVSVTAGQVTCSNVGGTLLQMRKNTSATTVEWTDIDTGSEAASTTYYVYANCDADATTFTIKISTSASAPSGVTSYQKLGTFYNNSSSNIGYITNYDGVGHHDAPASDLAEGTYSAGTTYQNTTGHKLLIVWYGYSAASGGWHNLNQYGQIGEASATTTVMRCEIVDALAADKIQYCGGTFVVPEGWYWKVTNTSGNQGITGSISRIEAFEFD